MDQPSARPDPLPETAAAMQQLHAWQQLQEHLQELHAKLEYLRLMLKLGVR